MITVEIGPHNWVLTPDGAPQDAWRPTVTSVTYNSATNTYTLTGTQISGLINGGDEGDDMTMAENYPIIWLKDGSGNVYYCKSFNFSNMMPSKGSTPETADFTTAVHGPQRHVQLYVSAVGVISKNRFPFTVGQGNTTTGAAGASGSTGGTTGTGGAAGRRARAAAAAAAARGERPGWRVPAARTATGGTTGTGGTTRRGPAARPRPAERPAPAARPRPVPVARPRGPAGRPRRAPAADRRRAAPPAAAGARAAKAAPPVKPARRAVARARRRPLVAETWARSSASWPRPLRRAAAAASLGRAPLPYGNALLGLREAAGRPAARACASRLPPHRARRAARRRRESRRQ